VLKTEEDSEDFDSWDLSDEEEVLDKKRKRHAIMLQNKANRKTKNLDS
jgi:hypothetical protein